MDNHVFFIVEPAQLRFAYTMLPLQARRERLGKMVRANGAQWANLRMRGADFMKVVERLDRYIGAEEELVNSAFENSPMQILPIGSSQEYDPLFGYYEPDRVQRYDQQFQAIPGAVIQNWENGPNGDAIASVVYAFRSTFAEAAKRKQGIAIDHC